MIVCLKGPLWVDSQPKAEGHFDCLRLRWAVLILQVLPPYQQTPPESR